MKRTTWTFIFCLLFSAPVYAVDGPIVLRMNEIDRMATNRNLEFFPELVQKLERAEWSDCLVQVVRFENGEDRVALALEVEPFDSIYGRTRFELGPHASVLGSFPWNYRVPTHNTYTGWVVEAEAPVWFGSKIFIVDESEGRSGRVFQEGRRLVLHLNESEVLDQLAVQLYYRENLSFKNFFFASGKPYLWTSSPLDVVDCGTRIDPHAGE